VKAGSVTRSQKPHKKGFRVFASARNTAKVQHLKNMGLEIVQLDVTDEMSIRQAVSTVKAATGGYLDFLINNSGNGTLVSLTISSKQFTGGNKNADHLW
jgi:NAD(P)-dependent dehydrogenase (short-subunit alcohol dehydrogenase family)